MLPKDFENYELRLRKLQESSREAYMHAKNMFSQLYEARLEEYFMDDALGTLARIRTIFCVQICELETKNSNHISQKVLEGAIEQACSLLPISKESRDILRLSLEELIHEKTLKLDFFRKNRSLKHDPLFPLLEDIFADGRISTEEMVLLEEHYNKDTHLKKCLDILPEKSK
jgi:hypothetical protein